MTQPPAGPNFSPPGFQACYRHPERATGIACQRCGRPICGECMNPASVGFQCPRCVGSGRTRVRTPRTRFGAAVTTGGGAATKALMVTLTVVYVLNLVSGGLVERVLVMSTPGVAAGQFWRLLTTSLVSGGLLGLLMNVLVLWLAGRAVESELGRLRFVVLFFAAGLGGAALLFAFGPFFSASAGAASAVVGLLGANAIGKRRSGEDIRPDVGLLVLLVLYSLVVGFAGFGWLALIGGIAVGALVGAVLAYAPVQHRGVVQAVGLLAVVALCLAGVVLRLVMLA